MTTPYEPDFEVEETVKKDALPNPIFDFLESENMDIFSNQAVLYTYKETQSALLDNWEYPENGDWDVM